MPELTYRRRLLVLAICCMSLFVVSMDNTIVNLALPSIQREFAARVSSLQWTIDAYSLVLASLLMLSGSTADRLGRRRTFQTGLTVFTIGSLLCSIAPTVGLLVVFRMVQAVGGSMLNPVAMSIVTNTFTEPKERARAIGVWGAVFGVSMALGPVVGGALVDAIGWRSIFWINVPIGIAAFVLAAVFVPESRAARARRVDPVGQLLVIVILGSLTYGIIEAPRAGWGSAQTLGCFALAVLAVLCLVPYEKRRAEPLIDPRFFSSVPFSGATLIAVSGFACMGGFLFLNAIYLQNVRGYSPLHAGLLTLPTAAMILALSPVSGRIVGSWGARIPLMAGGGGIIAAGLLLTTLTAHSSLLMLVVTYFVFGVGFGMVNPPITNTAVSGMPREQAGVASAVASTSRVTGGALGVAVLGAVVTSRVRGPLATGFAPASQVAWWIMVGCGITVLVLGFVTTGTWARRTAARFVEGELIAVGER
ncbi:MFS transporter [Amycolatopsis acidiphila]|uniref:MFS transporter n=1 Tax=Amycolatopsis acidiphila TaxID=715473 RepID=A0A558AAE5_9PSEU|nr:MFS transporter [Amycolatopsis acidiphila]TVT21226.1 MFS transporter [Amycolatopsis acidiphila]UIJ61243.1 MFS transporter [Amycolatopsis acidiphila]GHG78614.1 MFS transporter [Amycolatopsis acidiphila]